MQASPIDGGEAAVQLALKWPSASRPEGTTPRAQVDASRHIWMRVLQVALEQDAALRICRLRVCADVEGVEAASLC